MKKIIILFWAIALFNIVDLAQTKTSGGTRRDVADDGFTWFESFSTEEFGQNNVPINNGWALKCWTANAPKKGNSFPLPSNQVK